MHFQTGSLADNFDPRPPLKHLLCFTDFAVLFFFSFPLFLSLSFLFNAGRNELQVSSKRLLHQVDGEGISKCAVSFFLEMSQHG